MIINEASPLSLSRFQYPDGDRILPDQNVSTGYGFYIQWQNGTIDPEVSGMKTGASPQDVIEAVALFLEKLDAAYSTDSNAEAIAQLRDAKGKIFAAY